MIDNCPGSVREIASWAGANGTTVEEARQRFAQYAALVAITSVATLRNQLVLKGGNALDLVWSPNRSTLDLDFSLDQTSGTLAATAETIRALLEQGFTVARSRHGITFAVNSVKQQPPGDNRTFITFVAKVGYALVDQPRLILRMSNRESSPQMLQIEISINEAICRTTTIVIDDTARELRVSTREDIVAEKLRALLQQPIRKRNRRQDVLDIAVVLDSEPALNLDDVAEFLLIKAKARDVPVSKAAFQNPEISMMSRVGYDELQPTTRNRFIDFDQAFAAVLNLVDQLNIPEE